jgi:hypothetical protein
MRFLLLLSVFAVLSFGTDFGARAQVTDNPFAGAPTRYSVDVVTSQKAGKAFTMHVYVDGDKRRTEQDTNNGSIDPSSGAVANGRHDDGVGEFGSWPARLFSFHTSCGLPADRLKTTC